MSPRRVRFVPKTKTNDIKTDDISIYTYVIKRRPPPNTDTNIYAYIIIYTVYIFFFFFFLSKKVSDNDIRNYYVLLPFCFICYVYYDLPRIILLIFVDSSNQNITHPDRFTQLQSFTKYIFVNNESLRQ